MREQGYILPKTYRNLGLGFFILAILILASVFYLIWARVVIIITAGTQEVNNEFNFTVKEGVVLQDLSNGNFVTGKVRSVDIEGSNNFKSSGSKFLKSDIVGEVTIVNTYSKEQALVETTRLAASEKPDKVLVRLKKTVVVPPGGQVNVQVYPDDPEHFADIAPMKLIIPGLWGPLRDKIYAQNSQTLTQGGYKASIVTKEDLDQAQVALKEQLYKQAIAEVSQQLVPEETLWPKLVSAKVEAINFDATEGQEAAEFKATMRLKAIVVVFDETQVIDLARKKIKDKTPEEKQIVDINTKSFSYLVENYDLDKAEADIKLSFSGSSTIGSDAKFLDKSKLLGLTEEEVKSYLSQFPEVKSVEVKFQPTWLKKTPRIKDKIEIEISN